MRVVGDLGDWADDGMHGVFDVGSRAGLSCVSNDDNLESTTTPDDKWKIRLIEQAFDRPEFDVEDV